MALTLNEWEKGLRFLPFQIKQTNPDLNSNSNWNQTFDKKNIWRIHEIILGKGGYHTKMSYQGITV